MGIYINMEMPKSFPICIVIDTAGQARRYDLNNDRYADDKLFEAVPVPTPHGRCIDADALCNKLEKAGKIKPYLEGALNVAISFALTAPTIIPAEIISENEIKIIDTKGKSNYDPKRRFVISATNKEQKRKD